MPLNFLRNITIPVAEEEAWDKMRTALLPLTLPFSFCYLVGLFKEEDTADKVVKADLYLLIPGVLLAALIYLKTKKTAAPKKLMLLFAIIAFI